MHNHFLRLSSILIICISIFSIQPLSGIDKAISGSDAEPVFRQAQYKLAQGDTAAAMQLLDRALETDADHGDSRLWRGRLHLAAGDFDSAKEDFTRALNSDSPRIKARAHVGLGYIQIRNPQKTNQAAEHYRQAVKIDPNCFDAIYDPVNVGFLFNGLAGKRIASEALDWLIYRDPLYEDAYRVWRDLALDKRENEIREVDKRLEVFLNAHPDSASWWVDLAADRFYLGKTSLALKTLDEMASANPGYISADIPLLRARCYLEAGDKNAFYEYYRQALLTAESTGDFTRLFRQAEPLFYPAAYLSWEKCLTSNSRADFFRQFWDTLKPDPLDSVNPRLATHYSRLRLAEKKHKLQLPHIPYQPSLAMSFPENIQYLFRYSQNRFNRFWFIGFSGSLSDSTNKATVAFSNFMEAMQMQYDIDADIFHSGILTSACFRSARQGNIEVELYQGGIPGAGLKPKAEIAVFDPSWKELERKESTVYPEAKYIPKKSWLSVHRIEIQPGTYWFGVRTQTTEDWRWVERGLLVVHGFSEKELDLSGVVLGSLPQDNSETYSRKGIAMAPRPSLKFKHGEIVSVFLEIYNLGQNQAGSRGFTEEVNITLVKDDAEKFRDFAGGTVTSKNLDPEKSHTSFNQRFEKAPETKSGTVAESFNIDTSQLRPGNYRMVININDKSNGSGNQTSCIFELGD
jgi:tetratricopeptide (TPR) repeat protein